MSTSRGTQGGLGPYSDARALCAAWMKQSKRTPCDLEMPAVEHGLRIELRHAAISGSFSTGHHCIVRANARGPAGEPSEPSAHEPSSQLAPSSS
eukprot:113948-Prymnesium_polylepis.1